MPTNPHGVRALVWVADTSPDSVAYAVTQTKAAGFDLLEFSRHDADHLDVKDAHNALGVLRDLWEDSADLARRARTFIETQLHAAHSR